MKDPEDKKPWAVLRPDGSVAAAQTIGIRHTQDQQPETKEARLDALSRKGGGKP